MLVSPHRPACQARPSAVRGPACGPWSVVRPVVRGPARGLWSLVRSVVRGLYDPVSGRWVLLSCRAGAVLLFCRTSAVRRRHRRLSWVRSPTLLARLPLRSPAWLMHVRSPVADGDAPSCGRWPGGVLFQAAFSVRSGLAAPAAGRALLNAGDCRWPLRHTSGCRTERAGRLPDGVAV